MSFSLVRPYFRKHLSSLNFKEWSDGFNIENIPSTVLDKSYHIESNTAQTVGSNQLAYTLTQRVVISIFRKGFRTPSMALDMLMNDVDDILDVVVDPTNRLTTGIKNVKFVQFQAQPIAESNDNAVVMRLEFECMIISNFGGK